MSYENVRASYVGLIGCAQFGANIHEVLDLDGLILIERHVVAELAVASETIRGKVRVDIALAATRREAFQNYQASSNSGYCWCHDLFSTHCVVDESFTGKVQEVLPQVNQKLPSLEGIVKI